MLFKTNIAIDTYEQFVGNHPLYNLLQSSKWADIKNNWGSDRVGVYENDKLVASALVLIKQLPLGFTMMYIPRGPIMDYTQKDVLTFFMKELKQYAKKKRCLYITIDPGLKRSIYTLEKETLQTFEIETILKNMKEAGLIHRGFNVEMGKTIQPRIQANVYDNGDFFEGLPKHTKRLIKDAQKANIQMKRVGVDEVDTFSNVVNSTEQRKGIQLRSADYFKLMMDTYGEDCYLYLATINVKENLKSFKEQKEANTKELEALDEKSRKKKNRLMDIEKSLDSKIKEFESYEKQYPEETAIAGILSIRYGNRLEMLYAGMDDNFKKFMPQYALYVKVMEDAFAAGCVECNMGGVEGTLDDGLSKFKANFNPYIDEFVGEFDLPTSMFYRVARKLFDKRKGSV